MGILALGQLDGLRNWLDGVESPSAQPQELHLFSVGSGQLGAPYGIRPVGNRILVDGIRLDPEPGMDQGLLLCELGADGQVGPLQAFDVTRDVGELERLISVLNAADEGSAFAMTGVGRVGPGAGEDGSGLGDRLVRFFENVGVQSDPVNAGPVGFAYLFLRNSQGFVPLAESRSEGGGVHLAFQLQGDRSVYKDLPALPVLDRQRGILLDLAQARGEGLLVEPRKRLGPRPFQALSTLVSLDEPVSIGWRLGGADGRPMISKFKLSFESRVGIQQNVFGVDSGVHFELFLDGRKQSERLLIDASAGRQGWRLWSSEMDAELRSVDQIELRLSRFGPPGTAAIRAYLGRPRMLAGCTGD